MLRADLVVAVQCDPTKSGISGRNPTYSFYFAYASQPAAATAFRGYYAPTSLPDGDCREADSERSYQRRDVSGTLRCYTDSDDFRVFAWTTDEFGIVASAADRVMTRAQLADWWSQAGPIG